MKMSEQAKAIAEVLYAIHSLRGHIKSEDKLLADLVQLAKLNGANADQVQWFSTANAMFEVPEYLLQKTEMTQDDVEELFSFIKSFYNRKVANGTFNKEVKQWLRQLGNSLFFMHYKKGQDDLHIECFNNGKRGFDLKLMKDFGLIVEVDSSTDIDRLPTTFQDQLRGKQIPHTFLMDTYLAEHAVRNQMTLFNF